ncbi:MAG: hypothetical protein GXO26_02935, partial [Crenarchaeota archaeon]|nr:hypothetical protein [Thermoproteota archaeon]
MLKKDLCKILDLSLLEELNLDDTDLDVLMNHLTENIYELLNLYDYYSPSRLLLVPAAIDKAGDNILIFVSSNDRFSDIILENYASTLPSFSDIVLDYLDYVKYSKNLFPLVELFSFLPIIPLSHYTERDIMNLITETYRERSSSPIDVSLNITD